MSINTFKILLIILIIFFWGVSSIPQDMDTTISEKSIKIIEPIKINNDTFNIKVVERVELSSPEESLLDKYGSIIGALTGAFLAGIIAVYSVWKTNKNNLELERKKYNTQKEVEENKYCGLLFAVFSDLYAHKKISENLDSEIQEFLAYFETEPTIPTDNPFSEFPVEFMKICRNKILDFYKYETTSFSILTHYLNRLDTLHDDLNLKRIREARINVTDKDQVIAGMNLYFDQIKDTLDKLANLRSELIDKIPEIIKSYPQSEVEDLIEQVKNQ